MEGTVHAVNKNNCFPIYFSSIHYNIHRYEQTFHAYGKLLTFTSVPIAVARINASNSIEYSIWLLQTINLTKWHVHTCQVDGQVYCESMYVRCIVSPCYINNSFNPIDMQCIISLQQ